MSALNFIKDGKRAERNRNCIFLREDLRELRESNRKGEGTRTSKNFATSEIVRGENIPVKWDKGRHNGSKKQRRERH